MLVALALSIGILCAAMIALALFTCWRQRRTLPSDAPAAPAGRAAIIIPSKGLPPRWSAILTAFAEQTHPDFQIYVCVEDADDPGAAAVRQTQASAPCLHLVIAGPTSRCSQQNHNMLAGVRAAVADGAQWLAFADNDITPSPEWLCHLLRPLAQERYHCSTGYRWVSPARLDLANLTLATMNLFTFTGLCFDQMIRGSAVWGGSFALSQTTFCAADLEKHWGESISDDMTLRRALRTHPGRSHRCPELLLVSSDTAPSTRAAMVWFARQMMIMRLYDRLGTYAGIVPFFGLWAFGLLSLPIAIMASLAGAPSTLWWVIGGSCWITAWSTAFWLSGLHPLRHRWMLVLAAPVLQLPLFVSLSEGLFLRRLTWAGRRYAADADGRVTHIETLS